MTVDTLIERRTEDKILRMSEPLVMSKEEWLERGGVYHGTLSDATRSNYYSAWRCSLLKQPVTPDELANAKDFAMFKGCHMKHILPGRKKPCIPVFYREV